MYFAEHFSFKELTNTNTGLDNMPTSRQKSTLAALSHILEDIRAVVGKPLYINSAFRSPQVNHAVGGSRTSFHLYGCAADISTRNLTADEIKTLERAIRSKYPREVIKYDTFIHVAYDISRLGNHGKVCTWDEEMPESFETTWDNSPTVQSDF